MTTSALHRDGSSHGRAGFDYRAFGMALTSDFQLPIPLAAPAPEPDLKLALVDRRELALRWSGTERPAVWRARFSGGQDLAVEFGQGGDHLFTYGTAARFHLSADGGRLLCAPTHRDDPVWQRQLLDTILFSASLINGRDALHASAVLLPAGVAAVVSVRGGGKSTLAAELVGRGWPLVCDDVLVLEPTGRDVIAHPGPPIMNLPLETLATTPPGRTLATFAEDAEEWLAVDRAVTGAGRLATVFFLERRSGLEPEATPVEATALDLLPFAIYYRHLGGRERARFELMGDVAVTARCFRLTAPPVAEPVALAELVERSAESAPGSLAYEARGHAQ
jgi:hypothetical protein